VLLCTSGLLIVTPSGSQPREAVSMSLAGVLGYGCLTPVVAAVTVAAGGKRGALLARAE
jgi:hypothetical protein